MKTAMPQFLIAILIVSLASVQNAQAVNPPPDGGYPGGNTAEGQNALLSLTTGVHNTAVGFLSLKSDTTGSYNTAIGSGTLRANISDANTATGTFALLNNTGGRQNTANGALALLSNVADSNTAVGYSALVSNTVGFQNTAVGDSTLGNNTSGNKISPSHTRLTNRHCGKKLFADVDNVNVAERRRWVVMPFRSARVSVRVPSSEVRSEARASFRLRLS